MKRIIFIISLIGIITSSTNSIEFEEVLGKLDLLEKYANDYYLLSSDITINELILRYIRSGKYTSTEWQIVAGDVPNEFIVYVEKREKEEGTSVSPLRSYDKEDIFLPDGTATDFVHMFAVMNGIDYSESFTKDVVTLQGWAGDLAELFKDIYSLTGTLDELISNAREKLGISGGFGPQDLIADLDAVSLMKYRLDNRDKTFAELFSEYAQKVTHKQRIDNFIKNSFPNVDTSKNGLRDAIYKSYNNNSFIRIWECEHGIREAGTILGIKTCYFPADILPEKVNNQVAAVYAFADYIYENLK